VPGAPQRSGTSPSRPSTVGAAAGLYGMSLDEICPAAPGKAHSRALVERGLRAYRRMLDEQGLSGGDPQRPEEAQCTALLLHLKAIHSNGTTIDNEYRGLVRAIRTSRAALGLPAIEPPRTRCPARIPRPGLTAAQELALRGHSIAEIRRRFAEFEEVVRLQRAALDAGPPRATDLRDMTFDELVRDVVNRRAGVLSKKDVDKTTMQWLVRRHAKRWSVLLRLRGPGLRDWIPFRALTVLEAAANECTLNQMRIDAVCGDELRSRKRRKGGDGQVTHLLRSRPPLSVQEAFAAGLLMRASLLGLESSPLRDHYAVYRGPQSMDLTSLIDLDDRASSVIAQQTRAFFDECALATGVGFDGVNSTHVRATALRRIVREGPTLEDAMKRTGHDDAKCLFDYLEKEEQQRARLRYAQRYLLFQDELFEEAARIVNLPSSASQAEALAALVRRRLPPLPEENLS
jgi:hypothetical protein